MLIGMGTPVYTLPISAAALREVDLCGVFRYANTYAEAIEIVSKQGQGILDFSKLVTHRFAGLKSVQAAFRMAGQMRDEHHHLVLKVMVQHDPRMTES